MTAGRLARGRARAAGGRGRFPALALVAAAAAGGVLVGNVAGRHPPTTRLQPGALAAEAAPVASESSSWYCPAAPGPAASVGKSGVLVANAGRRAVRGILDVVDAAGAARPEAFRVPAGSDVELFPGSAVHGAWLASRLDVAGGGVSATELVRGRAGWSGASCASEVSPRWYFPAGATTDGSTLRVSLYNPTPDLAVADLSFVTAAGVTAPMPFQGLVVAPGTLRTVTVGQYVQNQPAIATIVSARSGAVVAGTLELYGPGGAGGLALTLGAPAPSPRWVVPRVEDATDASSELAVLNPSSVTEHVVVRVRLPSGPLMPFTQVLGPHSVWSLATSSELRIATEVGYALEVRATGGPGVVVGRTGSGTAKGPAPEWASAVAVTDAAMQTSRRWVVPAPAGRSATLPGPTVLTLDDPGSARVRVQVSALEGSGLRFVRALSVGAGAFRSLALPDAPVTVSSDGPVAVVADASPDGSVGAVELPAVPQS